MAATLPRQRATLAIELDPSGGDIAAWASRAADPGLLALADVLRSGNEVSSLLDQLPCRDPAWITAPTNGAAAEAAVRSTLPHLGPALAGSPTLIFGDLGRWAPSQPTASRLDGADLAVLVMRATPSSIEHARHLAASLMASNVVTAGLAIGGSSYTAAEIENVLGCNVLACLPWDPAAIDVLFREGSTSRRFARSRLAAAARTGFDELVELVEQSHVS